MKRIDVSRLSLGVIVRAGIVVSVLSAAVPVAAQTRAYVASTIANSDGTNFCVQPRPAAA